ncbi:MAG: hypothetical protein GC168_19330 [Candidatus Hydrogenedens sp.]|nr:hypothetical protein [Candidatus Hydrogenedens sp.]
MRPFWNRARLTECGIVLIALLWSVWAVQAYLFSPAGDRYLSIPENAYSTAVSISCGKGWQIPEPGSDPALDDFIFRRTETFDPEEWPDDAPLWEHEAFAETHAHLLTCLGYTWRIFGISWHSAKYLHLLFFIASALLLYGIFRIAMNPLFSAAGMLLFAHAPAVLTMSAHLRDFGKTPWLYASLLALLLAVARPVTRRRYFVLAALYGAILGVGLGFRQDLIIGMPIGLVCFAFFSRGVTPLAWWQRAMACALLCLCFYVPAAPNFRATAGQGSLMYHNMINGLAEESDERLSMGESSYEQAYMINDNFSHALRESYARRVHDPFALMYNEGNEAARWGRAFMLESIATFPGDFLTRALATCRYMFEDGAGGIAKAALRDDPSTEAAAKAYAPLIAHLEYFGLVYAALVLLIVAYTDAWCALALLVVFAYLSAYPSLQLHVRHAFPMTFLGYGAMLLFWNFVLRGALLLRNHERRDTWLAALRSPRHDYWRPLRRPALVAAVLCVLIGATLTAARLWQAGAVRAIAQQCRDAQLDPIATRPEEAPGGNTGWVNMACDPLPLPEIDDKNLWEWRVHARYLAVELKPGTEPLELDIRYEAEQFGNDFSAHVLTPPLKHPQSSNALYFFPVYEYPVNQTIGTTRFAGIALREEDRERFVGLYAVDDLSRFRLLPTLYLPKDPDDLILWKTVWPGALL